MVQKIVVNKTPSSFSRFSDEAVEWLENHNYQETAEKICNDDQVVDRDDEGLIRVTEELGFEAGKSSCHPVIVEIPDNVEWEIRTRLNREFVREKHREWHP